MDQRIGSSDIPRPEFELFPKLPKEMQLKIWKAALPGPQIVEIYLETRLIYNGSTFNIVDTIGVNRPPSILFHVCRQSRQVAKEKYTLQLRGFSLPEEARKAKVLDLCHSRIDPSEDTIGFFTARKEGPTWLSRILNTKIWSKQALAQVKHITFEKAILSESVRYNSELFSFIMEFQNLQDVTMCIFQGKFSEGYGRIPTDGITDWPGLGVWNTWALAKYSEEIYSLKGLKDMRERISQALNSGWIQTNRKKEGKELVLPRIEIMALKVLRRDYWRWILNSWWARGVAMYGVSSMLHTR